MGIYLPYLTYTQKLGCTLYTKNTLPKLICKPKDWVTTENKNNIAYETDCSNWEAVCLGGSERSLKLRSDEHNHLKLRNISRL